MRRLKLTQRSLASEAKRSTSEHKLSQQSHKKPYLAERKKFTKTISAERTLQNYFIYTIKYKRRNPKLTSRSLASAAQHQRA